MIATKYKFFLCCLAGLILFYFLIPLSEPLFKDDYSTVILDQNDQILRVFLNENEQWCFPPDEQLEIPKKLKTAVLNYEDKCFEWHPGINPISLGRAFYQNITKGAIISGASTITMQVARLMQPKSRTYLNKMLEMLQSLKIELKYSKDNILRQYLDHAPYGGNIVGYQAASMKYYGRFPSELTWGQAATLAVLPNAPGLISPTSNPETLRLKRDILLRKLYIRGEIDSSTLELA